MSKTIKKLINQLSYLEQNLNFITVLLKCRLFLHLNSTLKLFL